MDKNQILGRSIASNNSTDNKPYGTAENSKEGNGVRCIQVRSIWKGNHSQDCKPK
ncbi:hypothetical protein [Rhodocytophaga rosea]|uniref:hypothetical protein n=1 Tax=Rhodocytophaga rosea TaxID=2704465 RepID=UPI0013911508|nr:hypothetical protein [Rhodocytophaga rosea]